MPYFMQNMKDLTAWEKVNTLEECINSQIESGDQLGRMIGAEMLRIRTQLRKEESTQFVVQRHKKTQAW